MKEKVIVTGVNGFVGSHVVNAFKEKGYSTTGLAFDPSARNNLNGLLDNYVSCDLLDVASVAALDFANTRAIIHLAGLSAVGQSFEQPRRFITDNALMVYNLLEKAQASDMKGRVVVISTGALYDPHTPLPLSEESPTQSNSPYAVGKLTVEHVVDYFANRGLDVVTVRPFNHIGPGQSPGFILPDLYEQLRGANSGDSVQVGNLATKRDYTDVRDIARGYLLLALADSLKHRVYNLCSGVSVSGTKLFKLLADTMDMTGVKAEIDQSKVRPTDIADIRGDSSRIKDELGWRPTYTIEETIRDFVEYSSRT